MPGGERKAKEARKTSCELLSGGPVFRKEGESFKTLGRVKSRRKSIITKEILLAVSPLKVEYKRGGSLTSFVQQGSALSLSRGACEWDGCEASASWFSAGAFLKREESAVWSKQRLEREK